MDRILVFIAGTCCSPNRQVIQLVPPKEISASTYIEQLGVRLQIGQGNLSGAGFDTAQIVNARRFARRIIDRLRLAGDQPLFLAYSHGDIDLRHVLTTPGGDLLIDWDSSGCRSVLFDLYDGFFRWLRTRHPITGMTSLIEKAVAQLRACLTQNSTSENRPLRRSLSATENYRWIYYLERLDLLLTRRTEMSKGQLEVILRFYSASELYEEQLRNSPSQSPSIQSK